MKPYSKNTMKGFKPLLEIYINRKGKCLIHFSNNMDFYDTAKPEDRKRLNKIK